MNAWSPVREHQQGDGIGSASEMISEVTYGDGGAS